MFTFLHNQYFTLKKKRTENINFGYHLFITLFNIFSETEPVHSGGTFSDADTLTATNSNYSDRSATSKVVDLSVQVESGGEVLICCGLISIVFHN